MTAPRPSRRPPVTEPEPARRRLSQDLAKLEVVVCCGSGGVGKTTVSAALALALAAAEERRVLVLTVDPARRLATALGLSAIGSEPVTVGHDRLRRAGVELRGELVAAMLDMKSTFDRMVERYAPSRADARRILGSRFYAGISDAFIGSHEYMAMEALYELHAAREYDVIVIDTPPSRNALDFLEAPNRLSDFVGARMLSWLAAPSRFGLRAINLAAAPFLRMADRLLGGDVLAEVGEFVTDMQRIYGGVQRRGRDVYRLLRSDQVGFLVVTTLEPPAFAEAEFFCARLRDYHMPLRAIVVNRVLPDSLCDASALRLAERLAEDEHLPAQLAHDLGRRVAAEQVRPIGRRWLDLHRRAARDARQLASLGRLGNVPAARVPLFVEDTGELEGVAAIARLL